MHVHRRANAMINVESRGVILEGCVRFKPADRLPFRRTNGYHIVVQVQDQKCCRR